MNIRTSAYNHNFTGKYSPNLCVKIAENLTGNSNDANIIKQLSSVDIGGSEDLLLDIVHATFYNRYKYGINYRSKYNSFNLMDTCTNAIFYEKNAPNKKISVFLTKNKLPFTIDTLKKVTLEMITLATEELKKLHS